MPILELPSVQDNDLIALTHPGEILREDFLEPMGLSTDQVSTAIGDQASCIAAIVQGQHDISAETSLLLDRFFGLSDGYWLRLQSDYSLRKTRRELTDKIAQVRPYSPTFKAQVVGK